VNTVAKVLIVLLLLLAFPDRHLGDSLATLAPQPTSMLGFLQRRSENSSQAMLLNENNDPNIF
jgi:hypothetical protein